MGLFWAHTLSILLGIIIPFAGGLCWGEVGNLMPEECAMRLYADVAFSPQKAQKKFRAWIVPRQGGRRDIFG